MFPLHVWPGEAALRCGLGEKEDKLGSFTKKAMHIQLDRWDRDTEQKREKQVTQTLGVF